MNILLSSFKVWLLFEKGSLNEKIVDYFKVIARTDSDGDWLHCQPLVPANHLHDLNQICCSLVVVVIFFMNSSL